MPRFKRLTDTEARTLTRRQILDRVEAEQAYWFRGRRAEADPAGYAEFARIMHAYLSPSAAIDAAMATLEGRPSGYWESRPGGGYISGTWTCKPSSRTSSRAASTPTMCPAAREAPPSRPRIRPAGTARSAPATRASGRRR